MKEKSVLRQISFIGLILVLYATFKSFSYFRRRSFFSAGILKHILKVVVKVVAAVKGILNLLLLLLILLFNLMLLLKVF